MTAHPIVRRRIVSRRVPTEPDTEDHHRLAKDVSVGPLLRDGSQDRHPNHGESPRRGYPVTSAPRAPSQGIHPTAPLRSVTLLALACRMVPRSPLATVACPLTILAYRQFAQPSASETAAGSPRAVPGFRAGVPDARAVPGWRGVRACHSRSLMICRTSTSIAGEWWGIGQAPVVG